MAIELDSLLLDFSNSSLEEARQETKDIWMKEYMTRKTYKGFIGVLSSHDNIEVVFFEDEFEHAFFRAKNQNRLSDDKSVFDLERARRIRWIKIAIECQLISIECWECPGYGSRQDLNRRLYIIWEKEYVVWLIKKKDGNFKFETAYPAPRGLIRERYIRGGRKIPRD